MPDVIAFADIADQTPANLIGFDQIQPVLTARGRTESDSVHVKSPHGDIELAPDPKPAQAPEPTRGYFNPKTGTYTHPGPLGTGGVVDSPYVLGRGVVGLAKSAANADGPGAVSSLNDIADGVFGITTPLIGIAATGAPFKTAIALAKAGFAAHVGTKAAEAVGASPEMQRLTGNIAAVLSGTASLSGAVEKMRFDAQSVLQRAKAFDIANAEPGAAAPISVGRGRTAAAAANDASAAALTEQPAPVLTAAPEQAALAAAPDRAALPAAIERPQLAAAPEQAALPAAPEQQALPAAAERRALGPAPEPIPLDAIAEAIAAPAPIEAIPLEHIVGPAEAPAEPVAIATTPPEPVTAAPDPSVTLPGAADAEAAPSPDAAPPAPDAEARDHLARPQVDEPGPAQAESSADRTRRRRREARLRAQERVDSEQADRVATLDSLVAKATQNGYEGDPRTLHAELNARLDAIKEIDAELADAGRDPAYLVKEIRRRGGISIGKETGYKGELRWLKEHFKDQGSGVQSMSGVVRVGKDDGLTLDDMLTELKQDPKFNHIRSMDDLIDELRTASSARKNDQALHERLAKSLGEKWWEQVHPTGAEPSAGHEATDSEINDAMEFDHGDISFNPAEFDTLDTGEQQARLPEAGSVRDQNVATPQFEAPFSLSADANTTQKGAEQDLFAAPVATEATPAKSNASVTYNDARKAVEVSFEAKPDAAVIAKLKAEGFRWAKSTTRWYRRELTHTTKLDALETQLNANAEEAPTEDAADEGPTYRERRLARAERLRGWSASRQSKSAQAFGAANQLAESIPMGQPILVGHHSEGRARADQSRIVNGLQRGIEHQRKAEEMSSRAAQIERQADKAIYNDDANAIERITEKIADLEARRDAMKAKNAAYRKEHGAKLKAMTSAYQREQAMPHPPYELQNLGGNITRYRQRLATLQAEK